MRKFLFLIFGLSTSIISFADGFKECVIASNSINKNLPREIGDGTLVLTRCIDKKPVPILEYKYNIVFDLTGVPEDSKKFVEHTTKEALQKSVKTGGCQNKTFANSLRYFTARYAYYIDNGSKLFTSFDLSHKDCQ